MSHQRRRPVGERSTNRHGSRRWRRPAALSRRRHRPRSGERCRRSWRAPGPAGRRPATPRSALPSGPIRAGGSAGRGAGCGSARVTLLRLGAAIGGDSTGGVAEHARAGAGTAPGGARPRPGRAAGARPRWRAPALEQLVHAQPGEQGVAVRESRRAPRHGCGSSVFAKATNSSSVSAGSAHRLASRWYVHCHRVTIIAHLTSYLRTRYTVHVTDKMACNQLRRRRDATVRKGGIKMSRGATYLGLLAPRSAGGTAG